MPDNEDFPSLEELQAIHARNQARDTQAGDVGDEQASYSPQPPASPDYGNEQASYGQSPRIGTASNFTDWTGGQGFESDRPQPPAAEDQRLHATDAFGAAMYRDRIRGEQQDYENRLRQFQADQMAVARQREAQRQNPQNQLAELDQQIAQTRLSQPEQILSARLRQASAGIQEQLTNGSISPQTAQLLNQQVQQNAQQLWAREGRLPEMLRRQQYLEAQHQAAMQASIQNMNAQHAAQAAPSHMVRTPDGGTLYLGQPNGQALHIPPPQGDEQQAGVINVMRGNRMSQVGPGASQGTDTARLTAYRDQLAGNHAIPAHVRNLPLEQQIPVLEAAAQERYNRDLAARTTHYEGAARQELRQWEAARARNPDSPPPRPAWFGEAGPEQDDPNAAIHRHAQQEAARFLASHGILPPQRMRQQQAGQAQPPQGPPDQQQAFQRLMQQLGGNRPQPTPQSPPATLQNQPQRSWWQNLLRDL